MLAAVVGIADEPLALGIDDEVEQFERAVAGLPGERSLANSAAILTQPRAHADWVRPGGLLYGLSSFTPLASSFLLNASRFVTSNPMWSTARPFVGMTGSGVGENLMLAPGSVARMLPPLGSGNFPPNFSAYHACMNMETTR